MSRVSSATRAQSQSGPARAFQMVLPDDTADLPNGVTRSLFVSVAGDLAIMDASGNVATFKSAAAQYHPLQAIRVLASGTTAQGIVALY